MYAIRSYYEPVDGLTVKGGTISVSGVAYAPGGIDYVEVSVDNGQSWQVASGTSRWSWSWASPADGTYTVLSRVIDKSGTIETPGSGHSVTIA